MDLRYYVGRRRIKNVCLLIEHIDSNVMVADPLAKALPVKILKDHTINMGLIDSFNVFG